MPIIRRYHGIETAVSADASEESLRNLDSQYRAEGWEVRLEGLPGWRRARMEGEFVWYGPKDAETRKYYHAPHEGARGKSLPSIRLGIYTDDQGGEWEAWTPSVNEGSSFVRLEPLFPGRTRARCVYDPGHGFRRTRIDGAR